MKCLCHKCVYLCCYPIQKRAENIKGCSDCNEPIEICEGFEPEE